MGATPENILAGVGVLCAVIGVPASVYAVYISHQTKKSGDINQLIKDLAGDDVFCEKVIGIVVPSERFKERAREVFVDRVQMMINERHLVGGGEDREFKDGLRREMEELKKAIDSLSREVRFVLRRSDSNGG